MAISKPHTKCRICNSTNLTKYLDLGMMPLSNNLEPTEQLARDKERFPLQLMFCNNCSLSQLSIVIDPNELFTYYTYRSGINKGYINHCHKMAKDLASRFELNDKSFHIDIAGNDGTLLIEFQKICHHEVLNVDPAANLTIIAEEKGIPCITDFWELPIVHKIGKRADLITATNVFAHLDNILEFLVTCRGMLKTDSVLIIENSYMIDFIENMEFDTIYFEHVSYWSLLPMIKLCNDINLKLIGAEKQTIHGGSMRYIITRKESKYTPSPAIENLCKEEKRRGFNKYATYLEWGNKVEGFISDFRNNLIKLKKEDKIIIAFAACHDITTRIVTQDGLKSVDEITIDDKIYSINTDTGEIEIDNIDEIMRYPYDGELIHFYGTRIDQMVTPNHRMFYQTYRDKNYKYLDAENMAKREGFCLPKGNWSGIDKDKIKISDFIDQSLFSKKSRKIQWDHQNERVYYKGDVWCLSTKNKNFLVERNGKVSFSGNSAKGNTLLNSANISTDVIDCIIDETPEKIGKFYPGVGIPIIEIENIMKINPDYILILSWNFKEEIIEKVRALGYDKNFIVPISRWEII